MYQARMLGKYRELSCSVDTIYLIDWMEQINNLQNSGVHSNVTREQAMQCIIHTYIALGDILILRDNIK
jgi:hypothetical protein